jgi:uncharacterized membrane protein
MRPVPPAEHDLVMATDTLLTSPPTRPGLLARHDWLVPLGLVLLSLVPAAAGSGRLAELASDPVMTADNARFVALPTPVVAHVLSVVPYSILGALQVWPRQRRRWPRWHRTAGRLLAPLGLVVAVSGIWMTLGYDLPAADGARFGALALLRLAVGAGMVVSIALALVAVRRHRYAEHGAWMLRAYALAMGAGTQVVTLGGWLVLGGDPDDATAKAVLMGLAWLVNLVAAELVIRRGATRH